MKRTCILTTIVAVMSLSFAAGSFAADPAKPATPADLAKHLIEQGGVTRGVCAVLGAGDGKLALEIVRRSGLVVHVLDDVPSAIEAARKTLDVDGLWVKRVIAEVGSLKKLPYADNSIDLVVADGRSANKASRKELLRVLRPGGKAIFCKAGRISGKPLVKAEPKGVDDWSHWYKGVDNNPVSKDKVIKAPYRSQWFARPYYIAMPSNTVAAGGRVFLAVGHIAHHKREWVTLNTLIARNGYNGQVLWQRKLPDGYLVHRSCMIATDDVFYLIDGDRALKLDPETGKEIGQVRIPDLKEQWEWIAIEGDTMYVLSGEGSDVEMKHQATTRGHWSWKNLSKGYYTERVPWGWGRTLTAYDMKAGKTKWVHPEEKPMDSRAMVVGGGKVFYYAPDVAVGCIDAESGSVEWTNTNKEVLDLIEQGGRGLVSTPGFRSSCYTLYTPDVIFFQAQTRMNLVALSTKDGEKLWHKKKTTNNPNPIYVDGKVIVGIGQRGKQKGRHFMMEPTTGKVLKDLGFSKVNCVRLTATPDSLFVRGEGMLRYDWATGKYSINGAVRASCNDGVIPANGMLYVGPWQCDCNLSLMGTVAMTSAGDFNVDVEATNKANLQTSKVRARLKPLAVTDKDWATFRGNIQRSGGTSVAVPAKVTKKWHNRSGEGATPAPPVTAGGLVFLAGQDGKVRAIDADNGEQRWEFLTAGPILMPPTIANGRAYVGSGDGYAYALEAATGRLLWRFRGAPLERKIMVYGSLASSWPVNTGVLVHDGVAYFAAGIIDYDGTYVYAVDAVTGKIKWQRSVGHLNKDLRKGVSAQGTMTILGGKLILAGGNQINPASFDLKTGESTDQVKARHNGRPRANRGQTVAIFKDKYILYGGRLLYSAIEKVIGPSEYYFRGPGLRNERFATGRIAPVWNDESFAYVHSHNGKLMAVDADTMAEAFVRPDSPQPKNKPRWRWRPYIVWRLKGQDRRWVAPQVTGGNVMALAMAKNAVLAAVEVAPAVKGGKSTYVLYAFDVGQGVNGKPNLLWQVDLPAEPLQDGLAIDRNGRIIVACHNGGVICYDK